MQQYKRAILHAAFMEVMGKHCQNASSYGFPSIVPEPEERLDDEGVRYLYIRRLNEDALVVPYNPKIAVL